MLLITRSDLVQTVTDNQAEPDVDGGRNQTVTSNDSWVRRHPVVTYYILACAISWTLTALISVSLAFGFLALFGPAIAAMIVAARVDGRQGLGQLADGLKRWRVRPRWYVAAFGYPVLATAIGLAVYVLVGHAIPSLPGAIGVADLLLFVLVVGEEIGWRGYMLPMMLRRWSPFQATMILGVAWALWHAPSYLVPGMPAYGQPYLAFVAWVLPLTVGMTWLYLGTRSTLLTTIMHGSANLSLGLLLPGIDSRDRLLFAAGGYVVLAILVLWAAWRAFNLRPNTPTAPTSAVGAPVS